jgi:indolepyruvate decarboxylase
LVINLFLKFGRCKGCKIITISHEPGIGFAVDGYARSSGKIGHGMRDVRRGRSQHGEPVAGSFSERVPILVISGPGEQERELGVLIHHQAKEIELQFRIFREPMLAL